MTTATRPRLSLKKRSLFLGVQSLLLLGALEAAARLAVPAPLEWREHPSRLLRRDAERGWTLRPGASDFTVDKPVSINSAGFRDREVSIEKPSGTQRIVCVGDSYTYGWGVSVEDGFPKQLERALSTRHPTEALDMGVFGYNALQARLTLERQGLAYEPDLVIYSFYWDDLLPMRPLPADALDERPEELGARVHRALRRSRAAYWAVQRVRAIRATFFAPRGRFFDCYRSLLLGEHAPIRDLWDGEAAEICRMRDDAASVGARLAVVVWPLEAQVLGSFPSCRFEKEAEEICDAACVACVPLLEPLRELARQGEDPYLPYEQHPTPEAYRRAVGAMERALVARGLVK